MTDGATSRTGRRRATSLKTRLRASIVGLVAAVAITLSFVNVYSAAKTKFTDVLEKANSLGEQVNDFIIGRIQQQTAARNFTSQTLAESEKFWAEVISQDPELARLLPRVMVASRFVVEVAVTDRSDRVLASSDPTSAVGRFRKLPGFEQWYATGVWRCVADLLSHHGDYVMTFPLGVVGQDYPLFNIRVVLSAVLLRDEVLFQMMRLGVASVLTLLVAVLVSIVFSNLMLRPLERIGREIDRIATGEFELPARPRAPEAREIADVQSKLSLLGARYRGVREDALQLRTNIEQLLQKLEEAVLLFDGGGHVMMAGRTVQRFLGWSLDELAARTLDEVFPESTTVGAMIHEAIRTGQPVRNHEERLPGFGALVRVLINVEILANSSGRHVGTMVTLRDVETRTQLESQLNLATRLAAINRLTGGVAHEIKNPLNAIALHIEVLKAMLDGTELEAATAPEAEIISREITRLDRVVKTFLDFTRPVAPAMNNISLAQVVAEVAELVVPQAALRGVNVRLNPADAGPLLIWGDPDLLKQAILNVVLNGIDAMPGGGSLEIETREAAGECALTIRDHGVGIPSEARDRIFNLYFSTKANGSGIGLAVTFQVVQLHNGTIDFSSEPGLGTAFRLRFPAVDRAGSTLGVR